MKAPASPGLVPGAPRPWSSGAVGVLLICAALGGVLVGFNLAQGRSAPAAPAAGSRAPSQASGTFVTMSDAGGSRAIGTDASVLAVGTPTPAVYPPGFPAELLVCPVPPARCGFLVLHQTPSALVARLEQRATDRDWPQAQTLATVTGPLTATYRGPASGLDLEVTAVGTGSAAVGRIASGGDPATGLSFDLGDLRPDRYVLLIRTSVAEAAGGPLLHVDYAIGLLIRDRAGRSTASPAHLASP